MSAVLGPASAMISRYRPGSFRSGESRKPGRFTASRNVIIAVHGLGEVEAQFVNAGFQRDVVAESSFPAIPVELLIAGSQYHLIAGRHPGISAVVISVALPGPLECIDVTAAFTRKGCGPRHPAGNRNGIGGRQERTAMIRPEEQKQRGYRYCCDRSCQRPPQPEPVWRRGQDAVRYRRDRHDRGFRPVRRGRHIAHRFQRHRQRAARLRRSAFTTTNFGYIGPTVFRCESRDSRRRFHSIPAAAFSAGVPRRARWSPSSDRIPADVPALRWRCCIP